MKQDTFLELLSQGLIKKIEVCETMPSKGKALVSNKCVWVLMATLLNGKKAPLLSARGTQREWVSLDRLNAWLKSNGVSEYQIFHSNLVEE